MPKVTAEHRDARRREIAQAALRLFARKGFQATSVADIIAESGLSAGAIYGHYKSKDELVQVAITELLDFHMQAVRDESHAEPLRPPGEMVEFVVRSITSEVTDYGILVQVWGQASLDPEMRQATSRVAERLRELFCDYLAEWYGSLGFSPADASTEASSAASLYVGIMQGYVVQSTITGDFDGEAYLRASSRLQPPRPRQS